MNNVDLRLDRPKPHDEEAERYFLAWLIKGKKKKTVDYQHIIETMSEKDFYHPLHARIFSGWKCTVETNAQVNVDNISANCGILAKSIDDVASVYKEVDGFDTLLLHSIFQIKETSRLRQIIEICTESIQRCYAQNPVREIDAYISKQISNIYK